MPAWGSPSSWRGSRTSGAGASSPPPRAGFAGGGPGRAPMSTRSRRLHTGKLTGAFLEAVREGKYGVAEGVVCKGGSGAGVWMVKVKTYAYSERLKKAFGAKWEDYWE